MKLYIKTRAEAEDAGKQIAEKPIGDFGFHVEVMSQTRTPKQSNSLHLFCRILGDALNDAGFYLVVPGFKDGFQVPWTGDMVKENIWRPIQIALLDIKSTTKLNRAQVSQVYEVIAPNMAMKGINVPFPSNEPPMI